MKIFRDICKPAMVTTEVAITVGLAVVVAVIAIGLFDDNLKEMISSGNFKNLFNLTGEKTTYSAFNRDYTDSQINVQIMGQQGLEMLRQRANNKILDIISENPTSTDSNSVGYLVIAIESMVGQPDVCVYMKKESRKPCNDSKAKIGGYNYKVDTSTISSGLIYLTKVNTEGTPVQPPIKLAFNTSPSTVSTILGSSLKTAESLGTSINNASVTDIFKFIRDLTISSKPYVRPDALLMDITSLNKSKYAGYSAEEVKKAILETLFPGIKKSANDTYHRCYCIKIGKYKCTNVRRSYRNGCAAESINKRDKNTVNDWISKKQEQLQNSSLSKSEIAALFTNDSDFEKIVHILSQDQHWGNHTPSCDFLNQISEYTGEKILTCETLEADPNWGDWGEDD